MTGALKAHTTPDQMAEELTDILVDVQKRFRFTFDQKDVTEILRYTIRKCEVNGKEEEYIPLLFENELRDFLMRREINQRGEMNRVRRLQTVPV